MGKTVFFWAMLTVIYIFPPFCEANNSFKVVFLNPGYSEPNDTGNFWLNVTHFMDAAAADLNIELVTIYAHRNHVLMKTLTEKIIAENPKYVVLVNEKESALSLIKQIAHHDIPMFMLLNNISSKDLTSLSKKERKLLYGSLVPNNYIAGKNLINGLTQMYENLPNKDNTNTSRNLLALLGDYNTQAALARKKGLTKGLLKTNNIQIIDSTVANWSKQQAYQKVKGLLKRTRIDIIWAANDAIAFGAKKAVLESKVEYPVVIGGINWDLDDEHYPVNLSFGGHVTLGAKSLIMLRDMHDKSLPFDERHQVINIFKSNLSAFYKPFKKHLLEGQLKFYDFSRFSNSANNQLPFSLENLEKTFSVPEIKH